VANFSPNRAAGRIGRDQKKNAKPLRYAGVVGSAEIACLGRIGAPGGIRTPDQRLRKPLLYPAELQARNGYCPRFEWMARAFLTATPER
jgi:hypothetical protein